MIFLLFTNTFQSLILAKPNTVLRLFKSQGTLVAII